MLKTKKRPNVVAIGINISREKLLKVDKLKVKKAQKNIDKQLERTHEN